MAKGQKKKTQKINSQSLSGEHFKVAFNFGEIIFSSLDFESIIENSQKFLHEYFKTSAISLFVVNEKFHRLEAHYPNQKSSGPHEMIALDRFTLVGECSVSKQVLHLKNDFESGQNYLHQDLRYRREMQQIYEKGLISELTAGAIGDFDEILIVPLVYSNSFLGVLRFYLRSPQTMTELDVTFATLLGNQLSLGLHNQLILNKLQEQSLQVFSSLADAISKKDSYTGGHTKRVSIFSEMIAKEMNFSFAEIIELRMAAALHDIGKIGIPDEILKKRAPLNEKEFIEMKEHPRYGFEILRHIDGMQKIIEGIQYHHERFDGKGYPYGLKNEQIPLLAQIISVADTFDAMISTRPYRKGLPPMVAYEEILKHSGTQFSPEVVEAFAAGFKKTNMYREDLPVQEQESKKLRKVG